MKKAKRRKGDAQIPRSIQWLAIVHYSQKSSRTTPAHITKSVLIFTTISKWKTIYTQAMTSKSPLLPTFPFHFPSTPPPQLHQPRPTITGSRDTRPMRTFNSRKSANFTNPNHHGLWPRKLQVWNPTVRRPVSQPEPVQALCSVVRRLPQVCQCQGWRIRAM